MAENDVFGLFSQLLFAPNQKRSFIFCSKALSPIWSLSRSSSLFRGVVEVHSRGQDNGSFGYLTWALLHGRFHSKQSSEGAN